MNRFRRSVYRRLLALMALAGIGAWASAPLVAAHPQSAAAQMARVLAGGPLDAAIAEALASVASGDDEAQSEVLAAALYAALFAQSESSQLADLLDEHSPESLLALLLGQLLRSNPAPHPAIAAISVAPVASVPVGHGGGVLFELSSADRTDPSGASAATLESAGPTSIWELSSAQPLGP